MFTKEEATKERVDAYVAALEYELVGMEARIVRVKAGRPDPVQATLEVLQAREKDIQAEIKRAKGAAPKEQRAKGAAPKEPASE